MRHTNLEVGPARYTQPGTLVIGEYANGQVALQIVGDDGEPQATATVALRGAPDGLWLKGWSENKGVRCPRICRISRTDRMSLSNRISGRCRSETNAPPCRCNRSIEAAMRAPTHEEMSGYIHGLEVAIKIVQSNPRDHEKRLRSERLHTLMLAERAGYTLGPDAPVQQTPCLGAVFLCCCPGIAIAMAGLIL
jgi:hypothetical protein